MLMESVIIIFIELSSFSNFTCTRYKITKLAAALKVFSVKSRNLPAQSVPL